MAINKETMFDTRMYTSHGRKKNQGKWARVNNRVVLAYTEGQGSDEKIVGYTPYEEMVRMVTSDQLPEYQVDF